MTCVFSSGSLPMVGHLKSLLDQAGILCVIKNEQLSGAMGEIPFIACEPELWVLDDDEVGAAQALIAESMAGHQTAIDRGRSWKCPRCAAPNEAQFAACWRCGAHDAAP
jgi:Putative prokaryotic signal transducing protein